METFMKRMGRMGLLLTPFGILIVFSLILIFFVKPKLIQYAETQIPELNASQDFVDISVKNLDLSFLKLQINADNLGIHFKKTLNDFAPLNIGRLKLQLDPFKLLVGQISISKIQIDQLAWQYENNFKLQNQSASEDLPLEELFKVLPQIPVDQVLITDSNLIFKEPHQSISLTFKISQLALFNQKKSLRLSLKRLYIIPNDVSQSNVISELNLETVLKNTKGGARLDIANFNIKSLDSTFTVGGNLNNFKKILTVPEGNLKIDSEIHFADVRNFGLSLFPQKTRWPAITGFMKTSGEISFKSFSDLNGQLDIQTKQVNIDHFKLGQAQVKAEIKKNQIFINQIEVEHPSGVASLKEIEIEQKAPYNFKAQMNVGKFDLQKLFLSIGINDIPAGLQANGLANCSGAIDPSIAIECSVETNITDAWVKPAVRDTFHIVKIKSASVKGQVSLNTEGFRYKARLKVGQSEGTSDGQVLFAEGFKLNYETQKLSFDDVESLADLNFKGDLKIKGSTSGDKHHGLIDATLIFSNAEIDHFKLGQLESILKYEKGQLHLTKVVGSLGRSKYQGSMLFDFLKTNLSGEINSDLLYGNDAFSAFKEKFAIPFDLNGVGQASIKLSGPFDFWKLKYALKASLRQGQIADEGFEQLKFNLNATGEAVHFEQVSLHKNRSQIILEGDILTNQKQPLFALKLKAQPLYLEESDHFMRFAPGLTGQTWIDGQIKGDLQNPELAFNFTAKQINFENNDYQGSQGQIVVNKQNFKFNGQLFGRQIQSDIVWPWDKKDSYSIRLQIRDLNPLILLPMISLPQPSAEFYSRLNADVDLKSNTRDLESAEGFIKINDFILQRGALFLKLAKSSTMTFKQGLKQMDDIDLKSEANRLLLHLLSAKADETKLIVDGDLQLRQFQFLVPFAQSISGRFQIDSQVIFKNNSFELFGDGELTDGLVNLKGFPQAIENINTPIEFSKSKVILSDITAQLGQSDLAGHGQIDIKGHRQINVNLQASADNIELTFPEQITSAGKADLVFFGNWLPYTLKINYKVSRGLVEKDFGQDSNQNKTTLKASPYLPPQQIELQIPSLLLDVNIDMSHGIIIKNRILEGEAMGHLQINGTPENPSIAGQIDIKPGSKLIFKDKPFDIQTATIKFPGGPEINPDIYMTANSRVSDYDINLLVQGVPSKNLTIKPTSQPPLSESDIFSLLALGLTSSKLDQNLSSETQQQQTGLEIIATSVNQSQINKKFQEKFGLTVQLAPSVDSTKNIAVPKVVVSRKIQKNVNASYSRPLTGDTQNQEWKLQYLFNPNKSLILNYQNIESDKQDQLRNNTSNETGILGLDFEYKKEFK
jgi:translocation and assembly module TamB